MNADPIRLSADFELNRDPNRRELTLQLLGGRDHALLQRFEHSVH